MKLKKQWKRLLFLPLWMLIILLIAATVGLAAAFIQLPEKHPLRIGAYVLSAYTLTVWCCGIPELIRRVQRFRHRDPLARRWIRDRRFRISVTLTGTLVWNGIYAVFQLCLGIYHHSLWFYALSVYYASLALMRLWLARYTVHNEPGQWLRREFGLYRSCGIVFLVMNLALTVIIFYMVMQGRTMRHHEITTISMAAHTFTTLTMSIVNVIKYRRLGSPVFSASKDISLAAALVSMLTLESTMLTTFHNGSMSLLTRQLFLGISGCAVSLFIVSMAIYMIVHASNAIKSMELEYEKQ